MASKKAFQTYDCKSWSKLSVPKSNDPFILSTSRREAHNAVTDIGEMIKAKVDRRGGAGRKVVPFKFRSTLLLRELSMPWST